MRIHVIQHVAFEGPAHIGQWAEENNHLITFTHLYRGDLLPELDSFDRLVVMGGPMNIYEYEQYPWLIKEKSFIRQAIESGKTVLGICLGAQLIADVLGGKVVAGDVKEIGWFPVRLTAAATAHPLFKDLPQTFTPLHWHGDTFILPESCIRLAESDACQNQGFLFTDRVLGLQFHIESTPSSITQLLTHCSNELGTAPFIQTAAHIAADLDQKLPQVHQVLTAILERLP